MTEAKDQKPRWYCVQTKIGKEVVASVAISGLGFKVYYPVKVVDISHAGKRERVSRPLFPRYLFVSDNHPGLENGVLNYARGVANKGLFCDGMGRPQTIADAVIEGIRQRENAALARAGESKSGYAPGDIFTVSVGPFASLEAHYVGEENGVIWASIYLLGKANMVKLGIEALPARKEAA